MLAVSLSEQEIATWLDDRISIAAVNGPEMCVVSGDNEAVGDLEKTLQPSNVPCRYLHTSHAFHSKMIDAIIDPFLEKAEPRGKQQSDRRTDGSDHGILENQGENRSETIYSRQSLWANRHERVLYRWRTQIDGPPF